MKRNPWAVVMLLAAVLVSINLAPAAALQPSQQSLIQIVWHSPEDLAKVEAAGVPVYARLSSSSGDYFLAGATPRQIESLRDDGLAVAVLDPDMRGATYYLVQAMPGRAVLDWSAYGQVLLDDGSQVLLRTTPEAAERLTQAGAEIVALTLDPKPIQIAGTEETLPTTVDWDPNVQAMIDQVTSAQVSQYDRELAGEIPVWVDGGWYTITSRYTYSGTPIQKATSYVGQKMAALGLNVEYHVWGGATYPNVIGQITGLINPDVIYIIGGHIDAVSGSPGADDNASGTVAAMLAADIMSQFQWGCTLRFAMWTGEEQGLNGSYAYAQRASQNGENIQGYLNLDMIAWNTANSPRDIDLYYSNSVPGTLAMAQQFADVVSTYNLNLIPGLGTGVTGSDHYSFWQFGYKSILGIEDNSDFNPYYHTSQDTPAHTDLGYFTDFVKASIADFAHLSNCLIPSGIGTLEGHVTAASGGAPIVGATVTIDDGQGHTYTTTTDGTGYYSKTLLAGTYTVGASAYGYLPATVSGVQVFEDQTTTQDFALQTAPIFTVGGQVTDSATSIPLYAQVEFLGTPVAVWTDANGYYQAALPQGNYTMRVTAALHQPEERAIVLDHNQTQNFALDPLPCILLVDDDNNSPDTRPYFTAALDTLGYDYDVFDVGGGGGNGPDLAGLSGYNMVFWFSGDKYGSSAGPNSTDEANLTQYLQGGGRLFLSSQDYLYDWGLTTFGSTYLGIGSYTNDSGDATGKTGVAGDPIGNGLGPYTLTYPSGFTDYGDVVNAGTGASQAFRGSNNSKNLDVDKASGNWKTVFFGTDWAPIYNNNAANGRTVLQRIVDWFGGCEPPCYPPSNADFGFDPAQPQPGQTVTFTGSAVGTPPLTYAWDFGDGGTGNGQIVTHAYAQAGTYTVTMTVSNTCGQQVVQHMVTVQAPPSGVLHLNKGKMNWAPAARPGFYKIVYSGRVHDQDHLAAGGVVVTGVYTYPDSSQHAMTSTNDALGRFKFAVKEPQTGVYQLCVTDMVKAGYAFDPNYGEWPLCMSVTVVP